MPCEVRLYERLFNIANPSDEEGVSSFEDNLNPDSLKVVSGYVEKALRNCEVGAKYQFMRTDISARIRIQQTKSLYLTERLHCVTALKLQNNAEFEIR